jgi:hypothetical protein
MKRILFMAAIVLSLSACDNTKMQLRAPEPDKGNATAALAKTDSLKTDTSQTDSAKVLVNQ